MRFLTTGLVVLALAGPAFADKIDAAAKPVAEKQVAAPSKRIVAQQEAMKALSLADGEWRGPSKKLGKDGWVAMMQSERVATLLDGTVRTIDSRGFEADGRMSFSSFAIISYDPDSRAYAMRSWSNGRVRDYAVKVAASGFSWESQTESQTTVRYEVTVKNGVWTQTATRIPAKGEPEKYVEFTVKRVRE